MKAKSVHKTLPKPVLKTEIHSTNYAHREHPCAHPVVLFFFVRLFGLFSFCFIHIASKDLVIYIVFGLIDSILHELCLVTRDPVKHQLLFKKC